MTQISGYNTAPYQGVSQAPSTARLPENCSVLDNALVTIPQGCTKRPPYMWQGILEGHPGLSNGAFARVERDGDTDILLTLTHESGHTVARVYQLADFPSGYSLTGIAPQSVTVSAEAQAYLDTGSPTVDQLEILTVEDFTFITNRNVTVTKRSDHAPTRTPEGIVWVRSMGYARTVSVTVSPVGGTPVVASLTTPNGTNVSDAAYLDTDYVAGALVYGSYPSGIDGSSSFGDLASLTSQGFTVTVSGAVIYITGPVDFTLDVNDGQGGAAVLPVKDKVAAFSDLPAKAIVGFTVRITQKSATDADDFFVSYQESAGQSTGIWQETIAPGAELGFDPNTMSVGLVFESSAWHIKVLDWKPRSVGDQSIAPDPDFIGQTVQDISFWRGRLVVISGEGVTLSSADDPLRLYPSTLSSVLENDPVALFSPFPARSILRYGVNFNTQLIPFGDIFQAVVQADGILSPGSARIDVLTTYEFSQSARPHNSNGKVYFLAPHGLDWSTVYEMKVDRITNVTDCEDMTISVPRYVPAGINLVAACPINYLAAYAKSGDSSVYAHLFRYTGQGYQQQRVQNAWMRWSVPEGYVIGGTFFHNTELWMLLCKDGVAHLVKADTAPGITDPDASLLLTHLDFRCDETQALVTYDSLLDQTTIAVCYGDTTAATKVSARAPAALGKPEGIAAQVVTFEDNRIVVDGDWSETPLFVGESYAFRYQLSTLYPMSRTDDTPLRSGRMGLRRLSVDMADSGYMRCEVTALGRATRVTEWTGLRADDPQSAYDRPPLVTGIFKVPISVQNEQATIVFVNDSHLPSAIMGYEWVANLNVKAQRI